MDGNKIAKAPQAQMLFSFNSSVPLYKDDMLIKSKGEKQ